MSIIALDRCDVQMMWKSCSTPNVLLWLSLKRNSRCGRWLQDGTHLCWSFYKIYVRPHGWGADTSHENSLLLQDFWGSYEVLEAETFWLLKAFLCVLPGTVKQTLHTRTPSTSLSAVEGFSKTLEVPSTDWMWPPSRTTSNLLPIQWPPVCVPLRRTQGFTHRFPAFNNLTDPLTLWGTFKCE